MPPPLDQLGVDDLVRRARTGSLNAFSELVRRYQGRLYNFLRQRTAIADDAEDLAQEAFLRAWQRLGSYNPKWQFSTWLFTIASRLAAGHYRRQARGAAALKHAGNGWMQADEPADSVIAAEQRRNLWSLALSRLSETERAALWLRYAEDLSAHDIARVLGKTSVGVRVLMHRARRKLASELGAQEKRDERLRGRAASARPALALAGPSTRGDAP